MQRIGQQGCGCVASTRSFPGGRSSFVAGRGRSRATAGAAHTRHAIHRQSQVYSGTRLCRESRLLNVATRRSPARPMALKNVEPKRVREAKEAEAKLEEQDSSVFNRCPLHGLPICHSGRGSQLAWRLMCV
jgi:hypothetical protein